MATQDTVKQIKAKLADAWLRGKAQRIEIGRLLLELRNEAEHGTWGKLLAEIGIPPATAADYMTEASRQKLGTRKFEGGQVVVDEETKQMEDAVAAAVVEVNNAAAPEPKPSPKPKRRVIQLDERNVVKSPRLYCTAEQADAYRAARQVDKGRVYRIFHAALLEIVGQQEEVSDAPLAA